LPFALDGLSCDRNYLDTVRDMSAAAA